MRLVAALHFWWRRRACLHRDLVGGFCLRCGRSEDELIEEAHW